MLILWSYQNSVNFDEILHRLCIRNLGYDAYFLILAFRVGFGRQIMDIVNMPTQKSLDPQNPTKELTHLVDLLGQLISRNSIFDSFRSQPLPAIISKFYTP